MTIEIFTGTSQLTCPTSSRKEEENTRSLCSLTLNMMLSLDLYLNVILKVGAFLHLLMFDQGRLSSEEVDCTGVIVCMNRRLQALLLNCILLFLFCLLEQIEVLFDRYEHYILLLSTMYMYIDSLERRAA